jgi:hypothetical protein
MNPKNVRIGNYLSDKGSVVKITPKCFKDLEWFKEKTGIALTEDWISGFGLMASQRTDSYLGRFYVSAHSTFCDRNGYVANVYTVHQLQNLYFAMTGKELINRKITEL